MTRKNVSYSQEFKDLIKKLYYCDETHFNTGLTLRFQNRKYKRRKIIRLLSVKFEKHNHTVTNF